MAPKRKKSSPPVEDIQRRRFALEEMRRRLEREQLKPEERQHRVADEQSSPSRRFRLPRLLFALALVVVVLGLATCGPLRHEDVERENQPAEGRIAQMERETEQARQHDPAERQMLEARIESLDAVIAPLANEAIRALSLEDTVGELARERAALRQSLIRNSQERERERIAWERSLARERAALRESLIQNSQERERERIVLERSLAEARAREQTPPSQPDAYDEAESEEVAETAILGSAEPPTQEKTAPPTPGEASLPAQETEQVGRIASLAEITEPPRPDRRVDPVQLARERNLREASGKVLLRVLVGSDGSVRDAQVIRSLKKSYDEVAMEAVKSWAFTPPMAGDEAVGVWIRIPVTFR